MVDHPALTPRELPDERSDWMQRNGVAYWIGYAAHEPRDFAYCMPRRIACRLFGRHNVTCRGRRDHPRTW
ncbi:hypothetical protein [Streptomyces sp. B21-083]|uniref:hypothetical protein n=1 Tax=Streptomyces sp. B21-083 TaxID=3039410 RepID=UPI002FF1A58F